MKAVKIVLYVWLVTAGFPGRGQWMNNGPYGSEITAFGVTASGIFAGTPKGIYFSANNGTSWTAVNSGLSNLYITSCVVNGSTTLIGTDGGVYASSNDGASWLPSNTGLPSTYISALFVSGSTIFAGTGNGVFISNDGGQNWTGVNSGLPLPLDIKSFAVTGSNWFVGTLQGVFLSTNAGSSWTAVNSGLTNLNVNGVATSGGNLLAATFDGVFISFDLGTSWSPVTIGSASASQYAYSFVQKGSDVLAIAATGIFTSSDNGASWSLLFATPTAFTLAVSGTNLFLGMEIVGVLLSTDGGNSWADVSTGIPLLGTNCVAPMGNNTLFAGTNGGMFKSGNGGKSWVPIDTTLTYAFGSVAIAQDTIYGGAFGSGVFVSNNGGTSWRIEYSGLTSASTCLAICKTKVFSGTQQEGIFVFDKSSRSWSPVNSGLANLDINALIARGDSLIAGTQGGVFISTNLGSSWSPASTNLTNLIVLSLETNATQLFAGTTSGIFVSPRSSISWTALPLTWNPSEISALVSSGNNLFAAGDGGVYVSINSGVNWQSAGITTGVYSLLINNDTLYAGGLGVYVMAVDNFFHPNAPVATSPTDLSPEGFTANWQAAIGAATYQLDISTDSTFASFITNFSSAAEAGLSQVVTGQSAGKFCYRVRAVSGGGTSSGNSNVIQFCLPPSTPVISSTPNQLISSASSGNQWFLNGTPIQGAIGSSLPVTESGTYTVQTTIGGCSSSISADFLFVVTGFESGRSLTIYPNPAKDYVFVAGTEGDVAGSTTVTDMFGRDMMIKLERQDDLLKGDVRSLASGVYIFRIPVGNSMSQVKFIKQ